ncbi:hypothetical protein [Faecalibacillus intestinalis]|jgi:hypothetical protein|uniref:hypothetical protein n=1 Tax=Faecalibacillus intestinalis TaxID=1982626 RepID=UPI0022E2A75D|nr:hypothetical protein [Faecalibacillus intestinalis]
MNNLVNTIEIYSDLMTSNNHEKENLKEYLIENIKDKSFRNEFVNEINDFVSSPYFSFLESNYKSTINELIKNINEQFKEKHILNKNLKGIVYESAITLGQYATLLDKLHVKDMDNIFIYDIKEKNNFINEGKVGILLNLDNGVNIIDIPVSINDPLQMKIAEEQITSIIVQENIREEHYTNEQEEQEDNILEI